MGTHAGIRSIADEEETYWLIEVSIGKDCIKPIDRSINRDGLQKNRSIDFKSDQSDFAFYSPCINVFSFILGLLLLPNNIRIYHFERRKTLELFGACILKHTQGSWIIDLFFFGKLDH